MEPSESQGALRNDGWSQHHRNEGRKAVDQLALKLEEIKRELARLEMRPAEIGGS